MKKFAIIFFFLFEPISPLFCGWWDDTSQNREPGKARQAREKETEQIFRDFQRENQTLKRLAEENLNLKKKLTEIQASIALLSTKEKTPVADSDLPPSYETCTPEPSAPYEDAPPGYTISEKK